MLVIIYTSDRVTVGTPAYHAAKARAQNIAAQQRQAGKGGYDRWQDDYNDYSATGRFVVTARD